MSNCATQISKRKRLYPAALISLGAWPVVRVCHLPVLRRPAASVLQNSSDRRASHWIWMRLLRFNSGVQPRLKVASVGWRGCDDNESAALEDHPVEMPGMLQL